MSLLSCLAVACGDDGLAGPDAGVDASSVVACDENNLAATLRAVPNVTAVTEKPCGVAVDGTAKCFEIVVEQPIDHANPTSQFPQYLALVHRSCSAPTLVGDQGYANSRFYDSELSVLYQTNVLWIEHRYQGLSIPAGADWAWDALTIENAANDMHRIITAMKPYYAGRWVSTGSSKGGITATYHRYFFPEDVDGTVAYVAPASRARIDGAYQTNMSAVLPSACAQAVRDVQVAALTTRRDVTLAGITPYVGAANAARSLEYIMDSFDWHFWQYHGETNCNTIPTDASSDTNFVAFVVDMSDIGEPGSPNTVRSQGALTYEWLTEQGYALQVGAHVAPLLADPIVMRTMEQSFVAQFPEVPLPAYNGTVTAATRTWVRDQAEHLLLLYGQYDPWSGAALETPVHPTSGRFVVPAGTHRSHLDGLSAEDLQAALALVSTMFGREPEMQRMAAAARAATRHQAIVERAERWQWLVH
ncbi:MAG: hypothetical protein HOV81_05765 [Kofleriaceae bacterium]|nr:hypothetical protein [Kofleriaceae bacterium]